ncbi:MAG TPA: hypothetical protein VE010_04505 [Thermoanaerobaculia bacterium]|nr:hypothetical protein [Thermoanaerobaculia bacterium]
MLVRSRNGNFVLAFLGAVYALSAIAVLAWFVVDVWQAATLIEFAMQLALAVSAAVGLWFIAIAMENLRRGQRGGATSKPASIHR